MADANGFYHVDISYGPLYVFFLFSRIIVPYTLCMLTLIHAVRERSDKQVNRQYFTILGISTLPVIVLIAYVCKLANVYDFPCAVVHNVDPWGQGQLHGFFSQLLAFFLLAVHRRTSMRHVFFDWETDDVFVAGCFD